MSFLPPNQQRQSTEGTLPHGTKNKTRKNKDIKTNILRKNDAIQVSVKSILCHSSCEIHYANGMNYTISPPSPLM